MHLKDDINNSIEDFLSGVMSDQEQKAFLNKLETDIEFRKAFELEKQIQNASILNEEKALKDRMLSVELELADEGFFENINVRSVGNSRRWILKIAASIVLLAGALYMFQVKWGTDTYQEIYATYLTEESIYVSDRLSDFGIRGTNDISADRRLAELQKIYTAYKDKHVDTAKELLSPYLSQYPDDHEAKYILARLDILAQKYVEAIKILEEIRSVNIRQLRNEVEFNLGILLLKKNDTVKAKEIFILISQDKRSEYRDQASEILNKI